MGYIRLKDIAEKAGVSVNTVSRALKDKHDISRATRERIKTIADELGYIPNVNAGHLRSQRTRMIGIIITHIDNTFYARILQGINDAVEPAGYTLLTMSSNENRAQEQAIIRTLIAHRVSGLLVVPAEDMKGTTDYDSLEIPHIAIVRKGLRNTKSFFISDSYRSGTLAAGYMISGGRKNPAYIGFDKSVSCNRDRYRGYLSTLKENGIELPGERVRHCPPTLADAYETTRSLIESEHGIDGIFVYNDHMAQGVLRALHDMRIEVPGEVSLIGHDDTAESTYTIPALTTIRIPKYNLGFESARFLIELIEKKDLGTKNVIYNPELIIRET